ncbi:hypothetical protein HYV43_06950 [Candidatus Micrarchaeota archaeon]|nr:hypothetical protein [Candidatus Micrarchaeota archaeon]
MVFRRNETPWPESVLLGVGAFLLLYLAFSPQLSNAAVNQIHALQAAVFLSVAFLIGSLARFWPDVFEPFKSYRRPLGILGVVSAGAHVFMVFVPLGWNPAGWAMTFGYAASIGFLLMAVTSNRAAVRELGYPMWKRFHMLGYFALAAALVHFVLVELRDGVFDPSALEAGVMVFMALALLARLVAFLAGSPQRHSYDEHFLPRLVRRV